MAKNTKEKTLQDFCEVLIDEQDFALVRVDVTYLNHERLMCRYLDVDDAFFRFRRYDDKDDSYRKDVYFDEISTDGHCVTLHWGSDGNTCCGKDAWKKRDAVKALLKNFKDIRRLTDEQHSTIDSLLHDNWVEWNDLEKEGSDGLTVNDVKDVLRGFKSCEKLSEDVLFEIATRVFEEERYTVTDGGSLVLDRVDVYAGYSEYAQKRIDDECGAIPDDICDFIDTLSAGKKLLKDGTVDWFETETGEIVVWD